MATATDLPAATADMRLIVRRIARAAVIAVVCYCVLIPLLVVATVVTYSVAGVMVGAALATFTPHGGANE